MEEFVTTRNSVFTLGQKVTATSTASALVVAQAGRGSGTAFLNSSSR